MRNVRALIWIALAACGSPASTPSTTPIGPAAGSGSAVVKGGKPVEKPFVAIDLFAALGEAPDEAAGTWIAPAPIALAPGAATFDTAVVEPTAIRVVDRQNNLARVAVRLAELRFGAWIERGYVLSLVDREQVVGDFAGGSSVFQTDFQNPLQIALRPGAHVRRLARKDGWTQVRYHGQIEVTGWVPDAVLVDEREPSQRFGRMPMRPPMWMAMSGTVLRAKAEWIGTELGVVAAHGVMLNVMKDIDQNWAEVQYADDDVRVHAFAARQLPPGRVHRPSENDNVQAIAPNAIAPSGTCLFAKEDGEPIGYIVGDHPVQLDDSGRTSWFTLAIETPWSGVAFFAKGTRANLFACAPAGSVPAPSATPPPIPTPPPPPNP